MKHRFAWMAMAIASFAVASSAAGQASHPYFEYSGGDPDAEMVVPSGNFIPPGALEFDSVVVAGIPRPVTVVLRDPGFDGAARQVCVDYIGTDATFEDRFFVPGTTINWCNKSTCTDPTATPLGLGGRNWSGPYSASACFQVNVGQPIPFVLVSDVKNQGGNGTHTVGNGQTNPNAHWGVFPYPFVFSGPIPGSSAIIAVGLADGAYDAAADDDHQDLAVRFTVLPGPDHSTAVPTLDQWGLILLTLATAALGLPFARRMVR